MKETRIIGIMVKDRIKESGRTQRLLSKYAGIIRSRLGFHEVSEDVCSRTGIILVQLIHKPEACDRFEKELSEIGGIEVKHMAFTL